jgi:hypothetical protein
MEAALPTLQDLATGIAGSIWNWMDSLEDRELRHGSMQQLS